MRMLSEATRPWLARSIFFGGRRWREPRLDGESLADLPLLPFTQSRLEEGARMAPGDMVAKPRVRAEPMAEGGAGEAVAEATAVAGAVEDVSDAMDPVGDEDRGGFAGCVFVNKQR